ncbi:MAG: hypothetical protein H3C26_16080 [Rhodocyclaceae bacterium]|nr:hypothetical protein [Rhodocyclaceae bacterium]
MLIELVLWLCVIVPGLVYSIWRLSSKYDACPSCGGTALIPEDSPLGKKFVAEHFPGDPASKIRSPSPVAVKAGAALGRVVGRFLK